MQIRFWLKPMPPFRLDLTVWALRRRPANRIDRWDGATYRRVLPVGSGLVEVAVAQRGTKLDVTAKGSRLSASVKPEIAAALERLLGFRVDLSGFYALAARDRRLNALAQRFCGLKPPRFLTLFECLINAFTCQQLSLSAGIILLNRLAEHFGPVFDSSAHAFPGPQDLARLQPRDIRPLGYSGAKIRAMLELSRAIVDGRLDLEALSKRSDDEVVERLLALRGVGRWTAEYTLLRGLGRLNHFPGDDVGARNSLASWLRRRRPLSYAGVRRALQKWNPYAGLVYFHLLLAGLDAAGCLQAGMPPRDRTA
jgi:DNA-3-methyladenine glycosylase II